MCKTTPITKWFKKLNALEMYIFITLVAYGEYEIVPGFSLYKKYTKVICCIIKEHEQWGIGVIIKGVLKWDSFCSSFLIYSNLKAETIARWIIHWWIRPSFWVIRHITTTRFLNSPITLNEEPHHIYIKLLLKITP